MTYRAHGHEPSDEQIAKEGFKAFPPKGKPMRPGDEREKALMAGWLPACATGDADELKELAVELADLWPGGYPCFPWAYGYTWDDDE